MDGAIPVISNISYSNAPFDNPVKMVLEAERLLKDVDFDTMVGMGLSGSLAIPTLAYAMNKKFAVIRKDVPSHANKGFEGSIGYKWIFVDDFISSGHTLRTVVSKVLAIGEQYSTSHGTTIPQFQGAYLYQIDSEFKGSFLTPANLAHRLRLSQ